jgi:hypothetical protein
LFAVIKTGAPLGVFLLFAAPLPVLIAALGWNHRSGLIAAAAGAAASAAVFRYELGVAFAVVAALPAWWLAYLALLGRPAADGAFEWYPLGRLLLWLAACAAAIAFIGALTLGSWDFATYRQVLKEVVEAIIRLQMRIPREAPFPPTVGGIPTEQFLDALAGAMPFLVATVFALFLTLNLWAAAKVVAVSQRLPRPWPAITQMRLPALGLLCLAVAVALSFAPGFAGVFGMASVGALLFVFALQGLALLHDLSRGHAGRTALLVAAYLLLAFLIHMVMPLLAMAGIADTALDLRRRFPRPGAGPKPST